MLGLYLLPSRTSADEFGARDDIFYAIRDMLWGDRYPQLEALAEEYRTNQSRTPSGKWKLDLFYHSLDRSYTSCAIQCERMVTHWVNLHPDSPTSHLAYAELILHRAWDYRGHGFASEVPEKNWQPFYDNLKQAREYLEANKAVASQDPQWYADMIQVALGESWTKDRIAPLLEEGMARYPKYDPIYIGAAIYYLPKWHGSAADIEALARKAVEHTQAIEGKSLYARIYWNAFLYQYYDGDELFSQSDIVWDDMKAGIDDVLNDFPDQWNVNNFAYFACMAGDNDKALELINRIEGKPNVEIWSRRTWYFERCKWWAEVFGGW
jgi:hypothetical protein